MSENTKRIYFNNPQRRTQLIAANTTVIIAGRRTGKTDGLAAPFVLRNMQRMPGSTGGIVVPTYKHGLTNTIPGMFAAWERYGYRRGLHFVAGIKPPKDFRRPIIDPVDYEHVITFYNGSVAIILSQDRAYSGNSLTLSWLLIDEAKFIDYNNLKEQIFPANGGNRAWFGKHSCNHATMILSDMPQTKKGSWMLHYEKKMDKELINCIEGLVYEIWKNKQRVRQLIKDNQPVPKHLKSVIRCLDRDLNKLRSVAVYYKEYSSIENLELLGENYIKQMKRDLTPLTFQTSILCQKIGIAKDGFYSNLRHRHFYDASDFDFLDSFHLQPVAALDSRADADHNPDAPLCIAFDYNANINWCVVAQPFRSHLRVLKSFFVKFERKLPELIKDFSDYYLLTQHRKTVVFYFDATALGSNYAVNEQDFRWVIVNELQKNGWYVIEQYLGAPMKHDEKYLLINQGLAGRNRLMPVFNRQNNEDLILALQTAGVARGRNGFKKDKAGEKLAETEEDLLEHRTDGTDAFDTLYIGCEKFPQHGFNIIADGVN